MSVFFEDREKRRLIPRWRYSNETSYSAEFAADPRSKRHVLLSKQFLDEKLFDWNLEQNLGNAIDLLSCGLGGRWFEEIQPAARYLEKRSEKLSTQVNSLVQHVLKLTDESQAFSSSEQFELVQDDLVMFRFACDKAADARRRLKRDANNVLAWLDLARAYTILGQENKAHDSISRALYLAPFHRHIIRSAVRLFVHFGEFGRAHSLLTRNPRTPNDPWLIAAEVSVASTAERKPKFARCGWSLIKSSGLPPKYLTELHSAIGTLEFYNGSTRRHVNNCAIA